VVREAVATEQHQAVQRTQEAHHPCVLEGFPSAQRHLGRLARVGRDPAGDDEDLAEILFRPRPAETDDALWAQYKSLREEHRTLGDYWAGQRKGEVLVALRHSVDFVDAQPQGNRVIIRSRRRHPRSSPSRSRPRT
jgi:hypothetical protein